MAFLVASFLLMILSLYEKRFLFLISFTVVAVYFSCHFGYGFDWINYFNSYDIIRYQDFPLTEPGLFYAMKVADYYHLEFGEMMFLIGIFNYYCLYRFCKKFKNPNFALFCAFSFFGFYMYDEQIRQGIAVSIILLGLSRYGFDSKKIYIFIFIAAFFHVSALFFALSKKFKPSSFKSYKKGMLLISFVIFIFLLIFTIPSIISFIPYIGQKVSDYSHSYGASISSFALIFLISKYTYLYIFSLVLVYGCYKEKKDHKILQSVISLYFLMLSKITPFLLRFGYYFVPGLIYGLDDYFHEKKKRGSIFVKKTLIHMIILIISSATMWNPALFKATQTPLFATDSRMAIQKEIQSKCVIVYKTGFGRDVLPTCD